MRNIIIGAGDFGHEIAEYILDVQDSTGNLAGEIVFLDDRKTKSQLGEIKIISTIDSFVPHRDDIFFIAIGDVIIREKIYKYLKEKQYKLGTLIHPTAYISKWSKIEAGSIICPFSTIGFKARIGANVIINTYSAIGHHSKVDQSTIICPHATIAGNADIHSCCFIGSNAVVLPGKSVGAKASVSAGSVVYKNVKPNKLAVGNPAKVN